MKTYFATFFIAFLASLVLSRLVRDLGHRFNLTDAAWGRKIHQGAIPRLGGLAVAPAFLLPVYALLLWDNSLSEIWKEQTLYALALLVGSLGSVALGLWDDLGHVRARYKLLGQIAIAITVYFLGIQIHVVKLPFIGDLEMGVFAMPVTVFWILGFMNAINLIDGVDGLCSGVVFIGSATIFFVAMSGGAVMVMLFAAALAGAVLGFLRYNFNPATIFLGDSGSYFLGFVLAAASIMGAQKANVAVAIMAPLLAMGLPIMDTLSAITRRTLNGRPIFSPDRGHIHHRLLDKGYSTKRVVLTLYGLTALLAFGGLIMVVGQKWEAGMALALAILVIFYLFRLTGLNKFFRISNTNGTEVLGDPKAEILRQHLPSFFIGLQNENDFDKTIKLLEELAQNTEMDEMQLCSLSEESTAELWQWKRPGFDEKDRRQPVLRTDYPIHINGVVVASFKLAWRSESPKVAVDTNALLVLTAEIMSKTSGESIKGIVKR